VKLPSDPVVALEFVPTAMTRAAATGAFDPDAVTRPVIVPCADTIAGAAPRETTISARGIDRA
jgi:hypothetical protein